MATTIATDLVAPTGCSYSRLNYFHTSVADISSIVVVIMMAMVGPVPSVPMAWGRGIICIWIPGIWIVVDVRVPIVSKGIIIVACRISGVAARKSKTESLSSGN